MPHRIEVSLKPSLPDPAGRRMSARIASDLGFIVQNLRVADEFIIDRDLNPGDLEVIVEEVFQDPVIQDATIDEPLKIPFDWLIEVGFRPGVTDNVGRTAREAVERTLGVQVPERGRALHAQALFYSGRDNQGPGRHHSQRPPRKRSDPDPYRLCSRRRPERNHGPSRDLPFPGGRYAA